jgi:hypothetical protein
MLLWLPKSLSMHHYLMLAIYRRYPVITLDYSMGALHLCALIVGQVALPRASALADLLLVLFEPAL